MLTVRSTINISSQTVPQIIPVVQGDTGRAILFTLADFTIPAGASATYYVQKPSGEAVYNNATIDGNTVLVELTAQSIIEKGDNYGQVRIAVGEDVVTSFDFILLVKEFRGIDATQSLTEMNIFDKAVEQAADAIDEVKTDALDDIGDAKDAALQEIEQSTGNFADDFSASTTYAAGDYVMHSGQLYRFTANHAAGAWTGSDAEAVTVGEELTDLKAESTSLKEDKADIDSVYVTDTESGAIASFPDGADNVPVKSLKVNIEPVQSGSGDPSPTNIRPISGHTQAVVTRTGVNVWDEEWENGFINDAGQNSVLDTALRSKNYISVIPNTAYFLCCQANVFVFYYDENKNFITKDNTHGSGGNLRNEAFTIPQNVRYMRFTQYNTPTYNHDISINYPATDTEYHAYNGQTVTVDLGQTVYGGTLNATTGVLTVDMAMVDMGTLEWAINSESARIFACMPSGIMKQVEPPYDSRKEGVICSVYSPDPNQIGIGNMMTDKTWLRGAFSFYVRDTSYSTVESFTTAVSGQQMVYLLQNPQTIQLTAQEVRTLLGTNNVFADAGDVEVEYRADTKLYIQKVLNA